MSATTTTTAPATTTRSDHPTEALTPATALASLLQAIAEGRVIEAFQRFYAEDVRMQENEQPPTVGFAANLARERAFIASVAEWQEFSVLASGAGGEHTF